MRKAVLTLVLIATAAVLGGCGLTTTKTAITTVTRTVTQTVTAPPPATTTTTSSAATTPCQGSDFSATFAAEPGSQGAGNIVYKLTLTNTSSSACFVSGRPQVQLQDSNHKNLPTKGIAAAAGTNATVVPVAAGGTAVSEARFSPDVNGVGESSNPCEPKAYVLVVTLGGSTVDANIDPPTSVCSHGQLQLANYSS